MSFLDDKGFQSLLVLDPYPMVALCRLTLTREKLDILASQLDGMELPDLKPQKVVLRPLTNGCTPFATANRDNTPLSASDDEEESDDEESTNDELLEKEARVHLKGTEFEGLLLDVNWSGGFDLGDQIPKSVEKNLSMKMRFMNDNAPAFAGLQLIRTLLAEDNMDALHLLMAAESVAHSPKEARESLNKYRQFVQSGQADLRLHPWALIIAARLEEGDVMQTKLLSTYRHFFPLQDQFLKEDELDLLRGLDKTGTATRCT